MDIEGDGITYSVTRIPYRAAEHVTPVKSRKKRKQVAEAPSTYTVTVQYFAHGTAAEIEAFMVPNSVEVDLI